MNQFNTALTNIRRSPYQSLVAILILTITFFVAYAFTLFALGTDQVLHYFETRPQIIGFFQLSATNEQITQAESTMKTKPYVTGVTIISKQKALELYKETNKKDPLLLELVTADILPASIEVSGADVNSLGNIKTDLETLTGVEEVIFQENIVESLKNWTTNVRYVGIAVVSILSLTSLLVIMVMLAMKISNKRGAINIMRILGATRWYIKSPFVTEGMIYAFLGSLVGGIATYTGLLYVSPWLKTFVGGVPLFPVPWQPLLLIWGVGTLLGVMLTALASAIAVQRVMRK
jgi:cell division transport system permease protein